MLTHGAGVTTSRGDVHFVVTEFGIADLYGKTIRERARALMNIAHPDFYHELDRYCAARKYFFYTQTDQADVLFGADAEDRTMPIEQ